MLRIALDQLLFFPKGNPSPTGEAGQPDRHKQAKPIEERLDIKCAAKLLQSANADREDYHGNNCAPDVDSTRFDCSGPQECGN